MAQTQALIPHLVVSDAKAAIDFYKAAFGAVEEVRVPAPDGRLMHGCVTISGAALMLCDDFPEHHGGKSRLLPPGAVSPTTLHLNVPNCDAAIERAAAAGATVTLPPTDMFWGDRYAKVNDPFGHEWSFSHPLTPEQKAAAEKQWAAVMSGK